MAARSPLLIYLDTMDYSRFADIGHRNVPAGMQTVLTFLREKKALALIAIRYSHCHIMEFLKNPDERALALRKAQLVEELAGGLAFAISWMPLQVSAARWSPALIPEVT